jgi:hypothetical protein
MMQLGGVAFIFSPAFSTTRPSGTFLSQTGMATRELDGYEYLLLRVFVFFVIIKLCSELFISHLSSIHVSYR